MSTILPLLKITTMMAVSSPDLKLPNRTVSRISSLLDPVKRRVLALLLVVRMVKTRKMLVNSSQSKKSRLSLRLTIKKDVRERPAARKRDVLN
jgi:hypothetical protein